MAPIGRLGAAENLGKNDFGTGKERRMNLAFFGIALAIQFLLSCKAFPSFLFPVPHLGSVAAGFLIFIPAFWVFLNERGYRAFVMGGLSIMVAYMPVALYLINLQSPFKQGVYLFILIMFFLFLTGALLGGLVIGWAARRLPWAAVVLMPVLFESFHFILIQLSAHSGLIPPLSASPASTLVAFPPLIQMASFTGVFGVDFLVLFIASVLAVLTQETALRWPWLRKGIGLREDLQPLPVKALTTAGALALACLLFLGGLFLAGNLEAQQIAREQKSTTQKLTVALLQPNLTMSTNIIIRAAKENLVLEQYRSLLREAAQQQAELIVFPEDIWDGSLPAENRFWQGLRSLVREVKCFTLVGLMTNTADKTRVYNMWYLLGRQGEILSTYQKRYLIPFGEYIPYRPTMERARKLLNFFLGQNYQILKLQSLAEPNMDASPGQSEKIFTQEHARYFIKVCDELQFAQYFREGTQQGGQAIFSPATGEWFRTPLYLRHFYALACLRAVETRRWIGRTSSFANAYFVDAQGCLRSSSPFSARAVLVYKVPLLDYQTFYVKFGNVFGWGCVLLSLAALAWIGIQAAAARRAPKA
jgi:apolipoprotein N-acyltransferase